MDKYSCVMNMLSTLTVYDSFYDDNLLQSFINLEESLNKKDACFREASRYYSKICSILYKADYKGSLPDYLFDKILSDKNIFSISCIEYRNHLLSPEIKKACEYDLNVLFLLSQITPAQIKERIKEKFANHRDIIDLLPEYSNLNRKYNYKDKWSAIIDDLTVFYKKNGIGNFTKYFAFYFEEEKIIPIENFMKVSMNSLKKYDYQKTQIINNTENFINKRPALNTLLYGDRGTGKSTMVKAILSEYHALGLKMIQIDKNDFDKFNHVLAEIKNMPQKFIIFIDDLTFDENDSSFNSLKAVLEGSLNSLPQNVLIYATTNRRHIVKETFSSREGDEVHASDTRDESASLADRFGLVLTFTKPNLDDYLEIVTKISADRKLHVDHTKLLQGAKAFAVKKGSYSGRVARQFVDLAESAIATGKSVTGL